MDRPTIALAMIVKNEERNLPTLLESVKGCFDKIYICDTGSTDRTIEIAKEHGCVVTHFTWCEDFSKARNASFEPVQEDYVMWMDGDDVLSGHSQFIDWRDNIMGTADFWLNTYHYASDDKGIPTCSFMRERVFRRAFGFEWKYFIHEGVVQSKPDTKPKVSYVTAWSIKHRRTQEDLLRDKGRNLRIFEANKDKMDIRMQYYYGKELFENAKPKEAIEPLLASLSNPSLEVHDRMLGIQYLAYSFVQVEDFDRAIDIAFRGVHLQPGRAEYWCLLGDAHCKKNKMEDALIFYTAAKNCKYNDSSKNNSAGALFAHGDLYKSYPRNMIVKILVQLGRLNEALEEAKKCYDLYGNEEAKSMVAELFRLTSLVEAKATAKDCDDIVISCPPTFVGEWDWDTYKKKGLGGSETAVCEMAKHLSQLSGKTVNVFTAVPNKRSFDKVNYIPFNELGGYMAENKPYAHIAWRHNIKCTDSDTYVWSHDLVTPGVDQAHYKKVLALSEFHKNFLKSIMSIPEKNIRVISNGIDPDRFKKKSEKVGNRVVWRSSPDRGLDRAIRVMDKVRLEIPDAELHVFYGFDNMYKAGRTKEADDMKRMVNDREWITYHGNVDQQTLTKECSKCKVWLYPTNFEETYCISAIESLCEGVYPVVRKHGALKDTLKDAEAKDLCTFLGDCETEAQEQEYADAVVKAIKGDYWRELFLISPKDFAWENEAKRWLEWIKEDKDGNTGSSTILAASAG